MPTPKIKDVSVIATEPAGVRLVVVKVLTDQDGLYGYGCATFTQRADLIVEAVNRCYRALCEFRIEGVATNIPFLQRLLQDPDFRAAQLSTRSARST